MEERILDIDEKIALTTGFVFTVKARGAMYILCYEQGVDLNTITHFLTTNRCKPEEYGYVLYNKLLDTMLIISHVQLFNTLTSPLEGNSLPPAIENTTRLSALYQQYHLFSNQQRASYPFRLPPLKRPPTRSPFVK